MFKNKFNGLNDKVSSVIDNISISISIPTKIKTTKVAITGLSRSGKTIFITSLIDQLLHQKKINSIATQKKFKVSIQTPDINIKRFDYYSFQKIIKQYQQWPEGTDNISSIILEFESKSRFSFMSNDKFRIELIDYPGEWILDIAMLELSYEQWAKKTINWMQEIDEDIVKNYLKTISDLSDKSLTNGLDEKLHRQYSQMLTYLKTNHYSNLTPGRFLMPADLVDDPILLFAPIHESESQLHGIFKQRYEAYLEKIVKNIQLKYFKGFDRQIVLIDIVAALQNGHTCYVDMKRGLQNMLSLYDVENKNFISQWFNPAIKRVSFVATKADLITESQHNNYKALLNEMVEDIREDLNIAHIKTDSNIVASVQCSETVPCEYEGKPLSCLLGIDPINKTPKKIYPGEMPFTFPAPTQWNTEYYKYKSFLPSKNSYKDNESFDHKNMDKVIQSIIGDLL